MRIFDIIKSELQADKMKAEEELERVINNKSLKTDDKVVMIKELLKEIATTESSFNVFEKLTNKDDTKKEEKNN